LFIMLLHGKMSCDLMLFENREQFPPVIARNRNCCDLMLFENREQY